MVLLLAFPSHDFSTATNKIRSQNLQVELFGKNLSGTAGRSRNELAWHVSATSWAMGPFMFWFDINSMLCSFENHSVVEWMTRFSS
jgi:hypothetical protein